MLNSTFDTCSTQQLLGFICETISVTCRQMIVKALLNRAEEEYYDNIFVAFKKELKE